MQDNLKTHIESHIEDFESYPFDVDKGWEEVAQRLEPTEKKKSEWFFGIAAALAIILLTTLLVLSTTNIGIPNEIAEIEGYYEEEINQKISLVKNQIEDDRILQDLEAMDQVFLELKGDLKDNVDNEEVIMAMMENYRLKLQILEEIIEQLEKEEREESL